MVFNCHISYCIEDKIKRPRKISRKGTTSQFAKILFKTANPTNADFYCLFGIRSRNDSYTWLMYKNAPCLWTSGLILWL